MIVWCTWSNTTEWIGGIEDRKQELYNQCQYCSARLEVIHRVVGSGLEPLLCSFVTFNLITKKFRWNYIMLTNLTLKLLWSRHTQP